MKSSNYPNLLSPLSIGNVTLRNRLIVSAMVTAYCTDDGFATERYIAYHEEKAKGGWGLIITEDYAVSREGRGYDCAGLWKDEQIAGHAELVERVHAHGAKIFAQIYHAGRQVHPAMPMDDMPAAPSAIPCPRMRGGARELTQEGIRNIVSQFGDCALRAKKAGFDGVEVHGGHGYLLAEFLSWHANKRVDRYGGSLPNRLRMPLEVIQDIKDKCGEDFPIIYRFSTIEMIRDGNTIEDSMYIAHCLEEAGVSAIHASLGLYGTPYSIVPPLNIQAGWAVHLAEAVKKAVQIPVIAVSRITEPGMAENILRMKRADAVAMGRNSLADPHLPRKLMEGRPEDIRCCIGCVQGCQGYLSKNQPIRCLVNPELGFEEKREFKKAETPKLVYVAGGGAGGMQAAITAAECGHKVVLFEKADRLGGQFALACVPPDKGSLSSFTSWAIGQVEKLGIEVKLNTALDLDICEAGKPDAVIVAAGAVPAAPSSIPGLDGDSVYFVSDILSGKVNLYNKKLLVAGGGAAGTETADYLSDFGNAVTILEAQSALCSDEPGNRRTFLLNALERKNVRLLTSCSLLAVEGRNVEYDCNGVRNSEEFDAVILALGMKADHSLEDALKGRFKVIAIGDAVKARNAMESIREGFLAAVSV